MTRWHHQIVYQLHHFILTFRQHVTRLHMLIVLSALLLLLNLMQGNVKAMESWSWLDITGEGASVLFIAVWLLILLASLSKGRTITLLAFGLLGIYLSNLQYFIGEFIKRPKAHFLWGNNSTIQKQPKNLTFMMSVTYVEPNDGGLFLT